MRIFAALAGALFSFSVLAADTKPAANETFVEGKDYTLLSEQVRPAVDASKIEVTEVFSYTCPHCFHFEPLLDAWIEKQKPDVALTQIHTSWDPRMEPV
ncbi:MAG: thiol:disulfide interchange protein DsbA/DsbL, partial [Moraxellaceae bacterium]